MSYWSENRYKFLSVLIIVIIVILFIIAFLGNNNFGNFLTGNVIPELIGICIELLVIILIFQKWEDNRQHKKDIIHERRLREYLIFFLKHGLKDLPKEIKIGNFFGKNYKQNKKEIKDITNYLINNHVDESILKSMKAHLLIDKTAFENLLEVASQLTDLHFKSWIRIVYFINKLDHTHNNNSTELKNIIVNILNNIERFDQASYENKIYVGAI